MTPIGTYPAKIVGAYLETDDDGSLRMCFECDLTMPDCSIVTETARHPTSGEYGKIGKAVAQLLDIEWPDGLKTIDLAIGKECFCKIKHKTSKHTGETFINCYIHTGRIPQPATPEQIDLALAKLKAAELSDDDMPF